MSSPDIKRNDFDTGPTIVMNSTLIKELSTAEKGGLLLAAAICAVGILVAAYLGSADFRQIIHHTISQIENGQIGVGQSLLFIAVPIVGTGILIHLFKNQRKNCLEESFFKRVGNYIKQSLTHDPIGTDTAERFEYAFNTTRKKALIKTIAVIALAAVAIGGYFFFQHVPCANQWMHNQLIPALQHKIHIWEALTYVGGSSLAITLGAFALKKLFHDRVKYKNIEMEYTDPRLRRESYRFP